MSVPTPDTSGTDVQPAVLQVVALTVRPTAGTPVALATRVLDVEPDPDGPTTLVVACPNEIDPRETHTDATVTWTDQRGRMVCPVETRPGQRSYGRVWELRPSAPATRIQEREFFRVPVSVPVLLSWTDDDGDEPEARELGAIGVDLGEGGLLALTRDSFPAVGTIVGATVRVDGTTYTQQASVVRLESFVGGTTCVAVAFLDPTIHGDRFRSLIFETERRHRAAR